MIRKKYVLLFSSEAQQKLASLYVLGNLSATQQALEYKQSDHERLYIHLMER